MNTFCICMDGLSEDKYFNIYPEDLDASECKLLY